MTRRLLSALAALVLLMSLTGGIGAAIAEEAPVKITLLTQRHSTATNNIEDVWFFQHLEEKFNVELEMEQATSTAQRLSLMFGSDSMPDIVWGIRLKSNEVMRYGEEEGMLMDWNEFITPERMPNLYAAREDYPEAFNNSIAPDGKLYALPQIAGYNYFDSSGALGNTYRININVDWLKACNLEIPTNLDEYLNVLRTFNEKDPMNLGENNLPLVDNGRGAMNPVWVALGFCGSPDAYGAAFTIKDGKVVLPCYTEEARYFIKFWNTVYTEGLVSPDYFTMDTSTARGLISAGYCGVFNDSNMNALQGDYEAWVALPPMSSEYGANPMDRTNLPYTLFTTYVSSKVKPEVREKIIDIMDYMFSPEGGTLYSNGPMAGTALCTQGNVTVTGWYYDETGTMKTDALINGEPTNLGNYQYQFIRSHTTAAGRYDQVAEVSHQMAGIPFDSQHRDVMDQLTGKTFSAMANTDLDGKDGHWRLTQTEAMKDHLTQVRLPDLFLTAEESQEISDMQTIIKEYVTAETAKFIVGIRPLDQLDDYFEELRRMGIEDYIESQVEAYEPYMTRVLGE